jgi:glycerol-3-phosphate dehydrogenase
VRKALAERELLLRSAPHIMWPLRFVMPHDPHDAAGLDDPRRPLPLRPPGRREVLPGSTAVDLRRHPPARR